jgi:hypothetical protein
MPTLSMLPGIDGWYCLSLRSARAFFDPPKPEGKSERKTCELVFDSSAHGDARQFGQAEMADGVR